MTAMEVEQSAQIQRLRADGRTLMQIAAEVGVSVRVVRKALDPDRVAREDREQNARRNAAKRAWESEHGRATCSRCGEPMHVGSKYRNGVMCIVAPKGIRQRDYEAGWRACEADMVDRGQEIAELEDALERATALAERYGEAIVAISEALPNVNKVRLVVAGLESDRVGRVDEAEGMSNWDRLNAIEPKAQMDRSVRGVCPACGTALLFLGDGGYLTCSLHDCPDPTAADRLLFNSRAAVVLSDEALVRGLDALMKTNSPDNRSALRRALLEA
jgi:hypothetical protein